MKRRIVIPLVVLAGLGGAAYWGVALMLYNNLATVLPACAGAFSDNSPASFSGDPFDPTLDTSPYFMPTYDEVNIPSRDPRIMVSAWYVPSEDTDAPTVLITHGLGVGTPDCKRSPRALLPAGMLHRAGYNVLLIDLREHGDSTIEDGLWSANTEEYLDLLGAWDWLVTTKHFAPQQIGLFAYSGGTGASMIAMGQEPRIAAAWLDSVYADIRTSTADQLTRRGYPAFLAPGGLFIARLHGDDMTAYSPIEATQHINGRPLFITHSDADPVLSIDHAYEVVDALRAHGNAPEFWEVHGLAHVRTMFQLRQEYEQRLIAFFDSAL